MSFYLPATLLFFAVLALLLFPLLRKKTATQESGAEARAIYLDQLKEIERDLAAGLIEAEAAEASRREIARRLLEGERAEKTPSAAGALQLRAVIAMILVFLLGGVGLYHYLGRPDLPDRPLSERAEEIDAYGTLEARLKEIMQGLAVDPSDPAAWQEAGFLLIVMGRPEQAAEAYRQALANGADNSDTYLGLAEALVLANGGEVNEEARKALAAALERDPGNARALYYAGLALEQDGKKEEALSLWIELAKGVPSDLSWRPFLLDEIARLAKELGRDPSQLDL